MYRKKFVYAWWSTFISFVVSFYYFILRVLQFSQPALSLFLSVITPLVTRHAYLNGTFTGLLPQLSQALQIWRRIVLVDCIQNFYRIRSLISTIYLATFIPVLSIGISLYVEDYIARRPMFVGCGWNSGLLVRRGIQNIVIRMGERDFQSKFQLKHST